MPARRTARVEQKARVIKTVHVAPLYKATAVVGTRDDSVAAKGRPLTVREIYDELRGWLLPADMPEPLLEALGCSARGEDRRVGIYARLRR